MALDGKVAIVTGGAKGIGRAIAERFLRDGGKVIIADVDKVRGEPAEQELRPLGPVRFVRADVGKRLDVHNLIADAIDTFGDIDILVNNAGIAHQANFLDVTEADFDRVLQTNLKGAFLTGQAVARYMVDKVKAGGAAGTIINMSSVNAVLAQADQLPYSVSQGGISQLTCVMALALAPHGIRVNAIGPGSVATDLRIGQAPVSEGRAAKVSSTPLGRIGKASEIAGIAAFLASGDASYVTGQTIHADGGHLSPANTVPM